MARGYQKGNREKRKPKAEKSKPATQTSPFERGPGMGQRRAVKKNLGRLAGRADLMAFFPVVRHSPWLGIRMKRSDTRVGNDG